MGVLMPYKQFFRQASIPKYWEQHWKTSHVDYDLPKDNIILSTIRAHTKEKGIILEAGCGCGQFVHLIKKEGKDVIGLDFDKTTLSSIRKKLPALTLLCGDIRMLPLKEQTVSTYVSLGVLEHFEEGPEHALQEVGRILKKDGLLICSVPYHNFVRRIVWKLFPLVKEPNAAFYQYFFTKKEFRTILDNNNFSVIRTDYYDVRKTLVDLFPKYKQSAIQKIESSRPSASNKRHGLFSLAIHLTRLISRTRLIRSFAAHMILFVAKTKP